MSRTYGACLDSSLPSRDRKNSFSNKLSKLVEHVLRLYTHSLNQRLSILSWKGYAAGSVKHTMNLNEDFGSTKESRESFGCGRDRTLDNLLVEFLFATCSMCRL